MEIRSKNNRKVNSTTNQENAHSVLGKKLATNEPVEKYKKTFRDLVANNPFQSLDEIAETCAVMLLSNLSNGPGSLSYNTVFHIVKEYNKSIIRANLKNKN